MSSNSESSPGYSTANDFSGQEPVRGRIQPSDRRRTYRGYDPEDYPRHNETQKRSEYPDMNEAFQGTGKHRGKGPRNYRRSDIRITEEINDRLTDDPMVDASEIEVMVENGEATLNGTVDDRHAKRRAEDIAESVSGVTQVINRLRYRQSMRNNPGFIVTPY